jgi:hypothetical protein
MNRLSIITLKALRRLYLKAFPIQPLARPESIQEANVASKLIYDKLMSEEPCMIARFGRTELITIVNFLGVHTAGKKHIFKYIQGKELDWWWNEKNLQLMQIYSGFFPSTIEKIEQFCELMIKDIPQVDILGSWLPQEKYFEADLQNTPKIFLELLNPYFSEIPWTKALENKKVLVVHPFSQSIELQYQKRDLLFENKNILPTFELKTLKAVQTLGGEKSTFTDWFKALDYMKSEIDKTDYDICLIGCGAYGFPLAAHVKRTGRKAVHLGGSLQLLFGIKGKRWEAPNYSIQYNFVNLMNEHRIKPSEKETPQKTKEIEDSCYW